MPVFNAEGEVRAAGGVVTRPDAEGRGVEVLLVHRPQYDDWTLPKGKVDHEDETDEACAVREIEEETGLRCVLVSELPSSRYVDHGGRAKVVRYWRCEVAGGVAGPRNEVDALSWLSFDAALARLSYERDAAVLRAAADPPVH